MSIAEITQRQLIRSRIHDITDLAMDINLAGHRDVTVRYQPMRPLRHRLMVMTSRSHFEVLLPKQSASYQECDACLARLEEAIVLLNELLQEGQSS